MRVFGALQTAVRQEPVDKVIIAGCSPRDVTRVLEERLQEVGIKRALEVAQHP